MNTFLGSDGSPIQEVEEVMRSSDEEKAYALSVRGRRALPAEHVAAGDRPYDAQLAKTVTAAVTPPKTPGVLSPLR